jgi:hypothetical protein
VIPRQNPRPYLVLSEHGDLALEARRHRSDDGCQYPRLALGRELAIDGPESRVAQRGEEMRAACVEVGKVCAVGLVQVVVAFEERGVCGCDEGQEDCGGSAEWCRLGDIICVAV